MSTLTITAPAKLNLSLDVLGKRPDGYHELSMVMTSVAFGDTLTLATGTGQGVRAKSNLHFLPSNEKNLAVAAALRLLAVTGQDVGGMTITLKKRTPVCAGMGGGSSDAAAVLRGLNQLLGQPLTPAELAKLGCEIGSDVPYCVMGGTALAQGRGERLTPLPPLPFCHIVLCKPSFPVSTPALFGQIAGKRLRHHPDTNGLMAALGQGDLAAVARRMYNVFEDVLPQRQAGEIQRIKTALIDQGALGACMSGTGPTVFGLFPDQATAAAAHAALKGHYRDTYLTQTLTESWPPPRRSP